MKIIKFIILVIKKITLGFDNLIFNAYVHYYKIPIGGDYKTLGIPQIYKDKNSEFVIGSNFKVINHSKYNVAGINHKSIMAALNGGEILIGNNVGMSGVTIVAMKKIEIGDNVLIGANTCIYDNDFHPVSSIDRKSNTNIKAKEVEIERDVFIGANVIILKGVKIGFGSVIGAGSVVTKDVPSNVVAGGNPCKVVKHLSQ